MQAAMATIRPEREALRRWPPVGGDGADKTPTPTEAAGEAVVPACGAPM